MRRSSSIVLIWLVGLLLLAGGAEVTLHQHQDDGGHSCAVCGAAHASALPTLVTTAATPQLITRHGVVAVAAEVPLDSVRGVAHCRAPPTS